jgi:hypothetical protein
MDSHTKVRVVENWSVNGVPVVAKGAEAKYSVTVTAPKRLLEPGSVTLLLHSVATVAEKDLPITGEVQSRGREYNCAMDACGLLASIMWKKGHPGRLRSGTLVSGEVQI